MFGSYILIYVPTEFDLNNYFISLYQTIDFMTKADSK